jgi:hypothetical protein
MRPHTTTETPAIIPTAPRKQMGSLGTGQDRFKEFGVLSIVIQPAQATKNSGRSNRTGSSGWSAKGRSDNAEKASGALKRKARAPRPSRLKVKEWFTERTTRQAAALAPFLPNRRRSPRIPLERPHRAWHNSPSGRPPDRRFGRAPFLEPGATASSAPGPAN